MKYIFTCEKSTNSLFGRIFTRSLFALSVVFFLFLTPAKTNAQNVLVGLTSNGGPEGKGTAFSITTGGANYSVIQSFADWGRTPLGELLFDNGNFYGMTSAGGTYTYGSIYKMTPAGAITILKQFDFTNDGAYPFGELIKGNDGNFYGMTSAGGTNTYGTIFKISPTGTFNVLKHLSITADGSNPRGHLVLAPDGNFYGMTYAGGANGVGTIFKMTAAGVYTVIHSFNKTTEGGNSYSSLTPGKDGNLYGVTYSGGTYNYGTIFKCTTAGTLTVLHHISATTDGANCQSDLIQAADGNFYGTCYNGGANGSGTIFKMTPAGAYTVLRALTWTTDGSNPLGNLYQNSDGFLYGTNTGAGANGDGVFFKISTTGASYTVLHSFNETTEGASPKAGVVKGSDGNLYGTASAGGTNTYGTTYKITTAGVLTPLVQFHGASLGNTPYESLIKGNDSAYYGTASSGGAYGTGTIFKICGGKTTVLHSFNAALDGNAPKGSLILASNGSFYGMTSDGGSKSYGTVFKITAAGNFTVLHNFDSPTEGGNAQGSLVQGTDGFLYGMTNSGGPNGGGTVFKMSLTGTFSVVHPFVPATEGGNPEGNLIQATDGNFYGIATNGAKIFQMTPAGALTVLRTLVSGTDGSSPAGSLIQASNGKLYGTAGYGGSFGYGTIFSITTTGTFQTLKHINGTTDGKTPKGNLVQAADGNFCGMTNLGGTYNDGTLFKITPAGTYTVLKHFDTDVDGGNPFGSLIIAPVNNLVANPQSITLNEDSQVAIMLSGSGGSPLTFAIVASPKHGKLTGTNANRTFTPTANYSGKDSFTYSVSVGCIASAPAKVNITITPVADTPVLAPVGNKSVVRNDTLTFTASATDPDKGQTITYSLIGAPAGASINATTGVFTWIPTANGNFTFKVRATDNSALLLYDEEQITVSVTATLIAMNSESQQSVSNGKLQLTIYPNPVVDKFYIALPSPADKVVLKIIDMRGAVISSNTFTNTGKTRMEADASNLARGFYVAEIETNQGKQSVKFIKR